MSTLNEIQYGTCVFDTIFKLQNPYHLRIGFLIFLARYFSKKLYISFWINTHILEVEVPKIFDAYELNRLSTNPFMNTDFLIALVAYYNIF